MKEEYICPTNLLITESRLIDYGVYLTRPKEREGYELSGDLPESIVGLLQKHIPQCQNCREKLDRYLKLYQLLRYAAGHTRDAQEVKDIRRKISGT